MLGSGLASAPAAGINMRCDRCSSGKTLSIETAIAECPGKRHIARSPFGRAECGIEQPMSRGGAFPRDIEDRLAKAGKQPRIVSVIDNRRTAAWR